MQDLQKANQARACHKKSRHNAGKEKPGAWNPTPGFS